MVDGKDAASPTAIAGILHFPEFHACSTEQLAWTEGNSLGPGEMAGIMISCHPVKGFHTGIIAVQEFKQQSGEIQDFYSAKVAELEV